jgi:tetratricopeptide (TPR) repeat protein
MGPRSWADELTAQERLSGQFARSALQVVAARPMTVEALDGATLLAELAAANDPDNQERWRTLLEIAELGERDELRNSVLRILARLDPHDDVVRLVYLNGAIERFQTVEARAKAYSKLLSRENREKMGPVLASRLATDFALLLDRRGDVEGFGRWLAEAVALDPANRTAAAMAAGFFRMNVVDPFAEAELLVTLVLADPADADTQAALGQLLLEEGAYGGADRLYQLAMRNRTVLRLLPTSGLLADRAVALWGQGDAAGALRAIQERQRMIDGTYRIMLLQDEPKLTPLELARRHAPLMSTLATVRAAIHNRHWDDQAGPTLQSALAAYESEIEVLAEAQPDLDPAESARRFLEAAWVAVWLGDDMDRVVRLLDAAGGHLPDGRLSESARARFDGWIALRQGNVQEAIDHLTPLAESDPAAMLGLALAQRKAGRPRDAARGLEALTRSQRGTLMGVWAADVLAELVGQRVPPSEQAVRLEQLVASIPSVVDRFPDEPTLAISLRVLPAKSTFDPYEPIIVNLEVTNNAPFPMAIDGDGPIRPQIIVIPTAQISREPRVGKLRPIVVDIDRRLRLEPNERITVPVDLRHGALSTVLNALPLRGATLRVDAILNFIMMANGAVAPGVLGSETKSAPFRVDGVRADPRWIAEAIAAVLEPDSSQDLQTMCLLGHVASGLAGQSGRAPPELRQLVPDTAMALAEAYTKLDAPSRAWVLAVMPKGGILEPLRAMARKDEDKLVKISYLLYALNEVDDPMLDAARRGGDPDVRRVAELMDFLAARQETSDQ